MNQIEAKKYDGSDLTGWPVDIDLRDKMPPVIFNLDSAGLPEIIIE